MNEYCISTLDPAPAMTIHEEIFVGTYAEAVAATHASFLRTRRSTHLWSGRYPVGHWYHWVDSQGNVIDRNTNSGTSTGYAIG